jgi:ribosomal protein L7/L12
MSYHVNCKSCGGINEIPSGKASALCDFCGNAIQLDSSVLNNETEEIQREKEIESEIKSMILGGFKLHAIKLYMDKKGIGLKEANEYIKEIEKKLSNK